MMYRIFRGLILIVLTAVLPVSAATVSFTGNGDGTSWESAANWNTGVPTTSDDVVIDANAGVAQPGYTVNVGNGVNADCYNSNVGAGWSLDSLTIAPLGAFRGGWLMEVTGLADTYVEGWLVNNALYMRGNSKTEVAGSGTIHIKSGWWFLTNNARLTLTSGRVLISNPYNKVSEVTGWATPNAYIDVRGGTLQFNGNQIAAIQAKAALGWVKAYGGSGTLIYSYDPISGPYGHTQITAINSGSAHNPEPADGVTVNVSFDRDIQLNWAAVSGITSHKVYFGTNPNSLPLVSTDSDTAYTATGLSTFTTYYWRIDEVNAPNDIVGNVWSFDVDRELAGMYDFIWIGAGDRHNWNDVNNWYPKGLPDVQNTDWVEMYAYETDAVIKAGDTATDHQLFLGNASPTDPGWGSNWGWYSSKMTVEGTYLGNWNIDLKGDSILNVEASGSCSPRHTFVSGWAKLNINGGTYHVRGTQSGTWFYVSQFGHIYVNDGTFELDTANTNNVNSGMTLFAPGQWATPNSPVDIYNGQWLIEGDQVAEVNLAIDANWVIAFNGASYGKLNLSYDTGTNFTKVTATDLRRASNPTPIDGQIDVPQNVAFNWTPGIDVQSVGGHRIYFGTNYDAVRLANTLSAEYQGDFNSPGDFVPGLLNGATAYYWRIDEIDPVNGWVMGNVWQFTTAVSAISIEDFEPYGTGNPVTNTWLAGATGASIAIETVELPVGGGAQSLGYSYNNSASPLYSEIVRTFAVVQDFTANNSAMLQIQFKGQAGNAAETMYLAVSDDSSNISVQEYADLNGVPNTNVVKSGQWQSWYIDLSNFVGVDLTRVKKIYLGFGDRAVPSSGGLGTVYFDNIILSAPQCVNQGSMNGFDFSGDCAVNLNDYVLFADKWLLKGLSDGFESYISQNDMNNVWFPYSIHNTGTATITLQTDLNNIRSGSKSALWYHNNPDMGHDYSDIICLLDGPVDLGDFSEIQIWLRVHSPGVPVPWNMYCIAITEPNLTPDTRIPIESSYIRDYVLDSPFNNPDSWWLWKIDLSEYAGANTVYALDIGVINKGFFGDGYIDIDDALFVIKNGFDTNADSFVDIKDLAAFVERGWLGSGYWPIQ